MNIAIVTGASSGLGKAFADELDKKGMDEIWLIARRENRLNAQKEQMKTPVKVFAMDLAEEYSQETLRSILQGQRPNIVYLINSAGIGLYGECTKNAYEEVAHLVKLNVNALVALTTMALPYIRAGGKIIQVSSAASFAPVANFSAYAASKAFVTSWARSMNRELHDSQITVTAVCPGQVETEFFNAASGQKPKWKEKRPITPEKVVKKALLDAGKGRDISVCGVKAKCKQLGGKILPHKVILYFGRNLYR